MLTEKVVLTGDLLSPETWKIEPDRAVVYIPCGAIHKGFDSYEDCRKWVLKELKERRKEAGKAMDSWLSRQQIKRGEN